ncbi:MAG TPA: hypothetical protein VMP01_14350 [Pirellulaceae bacterium]|nr:hypothetical protein [Pirellulaceae bacterium]
MPPLVLGDKHGKPVAATYCGRNLNRPVQPVGKPDSNVKRLNWCNLSRFGQQLQLKYIVHPLIVDFRIFGFGDIDAYFACRLFLSIVRQRCGRSRNGRGKRYYTCDFEELASHASHILTSLGDSVGNLRISGEVSGHDCPETCAAENQR